MAGVVEMAWLVVEMACWWYRWHDWCGIDGMAGGRYGMLVV